MVLIVCDDQDKFQVQVAYFIQDTMDECIVNFFPGQDGVLPSLLISNPSNHSVRVSSSFPLILISIGVLIFDLMAGLDTRFMYKYHHPPG